MAGQHLLPRVLQAGPERQHLPLLLLRPAPWRVMQMIFCRAQTSLRPSQAAWLTASPGAAVIGATLVSPPPCLINTRSHLMLAHQRASWLRMSLSCSAKWNERSAALEEVSSILRGAGGHVQPTIGNLISLLKVCPSQLSSSNCRRFDLTLQL